MSLHTRTTGTVTAYPRKTQEEDYETHEEDEDDDLVVFDRRVTITGELAEIFRIFTEGQEGKGGPGEDQGYIGVANRDLDKATVARLRQRKREIKMKWVKGHSGHIRNEGADRMADEGARKDAPDEVNMEIPPELKLTGAKLSAMTQSLAYKAIRERKMKKKLKKRERTKANMERAKAEAEDNYGFIPTEEKIWKSFQSKDLSKQCQYFLWMIAHDAY
ncbi:hypothetical protein DFH08DRAFT_965009 [Mycena albidolilacea]|uniref:RNase H type-1 domain-containing protein n=1 Tax=Mycena albidolilacea TaxID=1033008 RepID=A0AAD6ZRA4_9AGAR|nr:hypothetical protein DFH08DRAFT_965009 [Mycena albidolilacea]